VVAVGGQLGNLIPRWEGRGATFYGDSWWWRPLG
jgi:hypothetical protein